MSDSETIKALLARSQAVAPNLPVIVKTASGVQHLGNCRTHNDASLMGLCCGIKCEKVSRAQIDGGPIFFLLH